MITLKLALLILCAVFVIPVLAFLCMKWGMMGYYTGKEVFKRQSKVDGTQYSRDLEVYLNDEKIKRREDREQEQEEKREEGKS